MNAQHERNWGMRKCEIHELSLWFPGRTEGCFWCITQMV